MKQSKIIQATQIDERCLSDIYRLPCVYGINKEYPTYIKEGQEPAVPSGDDNTQTGGGGTTGGELEG